MQSALAYFNSLADVSGYLYVALFLCFTFTLLRPGVKLLCLCLGNETFVNYTSGLLSSSTCVLF